MDKISIGVTGTGSLIGQSIIKSIQRSELNSKISIVGFDYFTDTVGSFWCASHFILPDILKKETKEEEWLEFIIQHIVQHRLKLVFVGVDFELPLFAKYKDKIERQTGTVVMVASEEVVSIANDKYLTYQFLKENNLSYPKSFLPGDFNGSALNYPVIVKPRKGARSIGVSKVNDQSELQLALASVNDPVIQECVGADTAEFTCGTIFLEGELKQLIVLNRTLKAGNTYISHFRKKYPEVISEYLTQVSMRLKPFGACNFQLRIDKNGIPKIFEINARHSGTTYIRSLFGFKEIEYIINSLLFNKEQSFNLIEGTVVRYFDEFFVPLN